jgi:uncharacterized membrane protein
MSTFVGTFIGVAALFVLSMIVLFVVGIVRSGSPGANVGEDSMEFSGKSEATTHQGTMPAVAAHHLINQINEQNVQNMLDQQNLQNVINQQITPPPQ